MRGRLLIAAGLLFASGPASAQLSTIYTVDTGGLGRYPSVVYGVDGLPLISYYDVANGDLKVAHCLDVACAASTKQTIDSAGDVGRHGAIAIGADGRGIISYLDATNARLKVAHCNDVACTSASSVTLSSVGPAGDGTDIAIAAGLPTISFRDGSVLRIARCVDATCSDATATSYAGGGNSPAITVGGDGRPLIAHDNGQRVFVGHCGDAACTTATFIMVPPFIDAEGASILGLWYEPSLATRPDGRGAVTMTRRRIYPTGQDYAIGLALCQDVACTAAPLADGFFVGVAPTGASDPDIAVTPADRPVVAWTRYEPVMATHLQAALCAIPDCTTATVGLLDGPAAGLDPSVGLSPTGIPLIAYHDVAAGSLKAAYVTGSPVADLRAIVSALPDPVAPTQTLRYTVSAQNLGPHQATAVSAQIALPPNVTFEAASLGCSYDPASHSVLCPGPNVPVSSTIELATVDVVAPAGVPGPLVATATVSSTTADPDPANNSATASTAMTLGLRVASPTIVEGNVGQTEARFDLTLFDNGNGVPSPVTVFYNQGGGTATPGSDYVPAVGTLTFASAGTQSVPVGVLDDFALEPEEFFFMQLALPVAVTVVTNPPATIVDDDVTPLARTELAHGSSVRTDLGGVQEHVFRLLVPAGASFEVVVDGISGDLLPLSLQRLDATGTAVLQQATPEGTGASASMRWENMSAVPVANQLVSVRSGGCTTDCGADDVYRLRAYETTASIPRFNNSGSQVSVLLLQNPSNRTITGTLHFWRPNGGLLTSSPMSIAPRATAVVNTAVFAAGQGGSVTLSHDGPYGVLRGKAVALEPATGYSFDSPLEYRPR